MFIHNINPIFFEIGPIQIRYYGLIFALAFLVTYLFMQKIAKEGKIKNFTQENSETLLIYIILGVIIGARIFEFIFYQTNVLLSDPLQIIYIWQGGLSFHGGMVGMAIALTIFCKQFKVKFYDLADYLVLPAAFGLVFGRIANFINGELPGTPSNASWCVVFPKTDDVCRHPSQLYESAKNALIFITLYLMHAKKKFESGIIFWTFILMYGILRFIVNFWREDPTMLGISMGQFLCLPMIAVAAIFLYKINNKNKKRDKK